MNEGKQFEKDFAGSFGFDIFIYKLRDSASFGQASMSCKTRFTANNICDYIAYINKELYLLELKSIKGKSLPFSNIRPQQLKGLYEEGKKEGVNSYFIINFREVEETYAVSAGSLWNFIENTDRKSISLKDCREIGKLIRQTKKKVHYTYTTEDLTAK